MSGEIKTILILGASSDIGCALIRAIADEFDIIFAHCNKNIKKIEELQKEINTKIIPISADLRNSHGSTDLIGEINKYCSYPSKIVHMSAPKFSYIRFRDLKWENFQNELDVQLRPAVMVLKEFLPLMAQEKSGKVVFMLSSVTLGNPPKALSGYVSVKYALLGLMKALSVEYAEKNIQINAISPSMVETQFLSEISEKFIELSAANSPMKRNAGISDVIPMIQFLLSNKSDYITGQNIYITGGS